MTNEKYPLALPQGTILAGQYVIEQVLGQGGFGITYKALDHKSGMPVALKEYFPDSMATRRQTTVTAFAGERAESFTYGKTCFLQEAETLAEFIGNENIVRVYSYFEENQTAYFVMEYVEGTSFEDYIKEHGGKISYEESERILLPVIDALAAVHSRGIIHRDVTPDNICITKDGKVKLLDFGAARYSLGDKSRSLDVVLKHGFAPKEQYTRRGKQGPFTDVYTLGASFYYAITGRIPPDSIDRMEEDELIPPGNLGVTIPAVKEEAILTAMNVQPQERFQNMEAFRQALLMGEGTSPQNPMQQETADAPKTEAGQGEVQQRIFSAPATQTPLMQNREPNQQVNQQQRGFEYQKKKGLFWILAGSAAVVVIVAGIAVVSFRAGISDNRERDVAHYDLESKSSVSADIPVNQPEQPKEAEDYTGFDINGVDNIYLTLKGTIAEESGQLLLVTEQPVSVCALDSSSQVVKREAVTEIFLSDNEEADNSIGAEISVRGKLSANENGDFELEIVDLDIEKEAVSEEEFSENHKYLLVQEDVTWQEAYQDSISRGGYLLRIGSEEEFQMIIRMIEDADMQKVHFYLGGLREMNSRVYYWVDQNGKKMDQMLNPEGSSWAASHWMEKEPSFAAGGDLEMYMNLIYYQEEWVLNDVSGDITVYYPGKTGYIVEFDK